MHLFYKVKTEKKKKIIKHTILTEHQRVSIKTNM